ncbi:pantothenate transporter liz1 [Podospora fimiseda]|uniref:Pantothenate transporter liz1 n=1 Tax=Podospora fimiseda TaxID=252190 RepID=A0AAN7BL50_9PEZI|nr:pantothenate transporter liz1 [Podospora fimiseda]
MSKIKYFHRGNKLPGESFLVFKIDFFILTFCCLSYLLNYLDRSNLANAYVSGMKEDLDFKGDQLTQINTCFTVGYILGQIPSNVSLHYIPPSKFFPGAMIIWACLTMITATVKNPQSIMAIRFFQGIAESTTFVGTHYILGSWYTERELGKRSGIFTASGLAGTMIGGFIQSGIYTSLEGLKVMRGWRWLFIIDGIITLPVAVYGLFLFPDTPGTTKAFYLSQQERELAVTRLQPSPTPKETETTASTSPGSEKAIISENPPSSTKEQSPFTRAFVKKILISAEWYGFIILWILAGSSESFSSNSLLALYLKSNPFNTPYTVQQLNSYPTGVSAVGIVSTLFFATLTDIYPHTRHTVGYFIGVIGIVTSGMILAAKYEMVGNQTGVVMGAYYWAGAVYACQATFFAWANDSMRGKEEVFRGVVLAGMNLGSNAVNAWWSILFYGAGMAPWFERGMWAMIGDCLVLVVWCGGLEYVLRRRERGSGGGVVV